MLEEAGRNRLQNGGGRDESTGTERRTSVRSETLSLKVAKENEIKYNEEKGKKVEEKDNESL